MRAVLIVVTVAALGAVATSALAACRWTWDCTSGQCRQVPICDSPIDIVPPRPPGIPPIAPPSIRPIQSPIVPPVGTGSCSKQYLCQQGTCDWKTVCR
jgi:hypothetical protein